MRKTIQLLLISLIVIFEAVPVLAQQTGDTISSNGLKYKVLSSNLVPNSGFESGFTGWTDATTSAALLTSANFSLIATGGINNSQYLTGLKNESSTSAGSIGTGWPLQSGKTYYFSYYVKYLSTSTAAGTEQWAKISLTNDKTSSAEPRVLINASNVNGGGTWTKNEVVFTNTNPAYSYIVARFRWLGNRLGFDNFSLFEVQEVASSASLQTCIDEAKALYKPDASGAAELQAAITKAETYLSSQSTTEINQAINDLKNAIQHFKLQNASPANPLNMTHLIVNPGFDGNTSEGWKGIGTINYHEVEFYQRTFNMYQKIAGLPAGKYVLKAQGFERPKNNDGGAAYRAGTENISAIFYAKANSFPQKNSQFSSLYKQSYTGTGSANGYVNTMAAAETLMGNANRYYDMTVSDISLNAGDTLTIGARSDFQQTGYWALFDNFRLEYQGSLDTTDLKNELLKQVEIAGELLGKKIQNSVRTNLTTSIAQAREALNAVPLVFETLSAANNLINSAVNEGHKSVDIYNRLQALITEAEQTSSTLSAAKQQSLVSVLSNARTNVENPDATTAVLNKSISDISALIYKRIYVPAWMMGDVNNPNNNWSYSRSRQSKNWIVFWEPGYGEDPSVLADGGFRIDIDGILNLAESFYKFYADSLKFVTRGTSKTDDYKMIIRLRYTRDWEATGSGVDNLIGLLTLTAWSAQAGGHTLAHEVGHCFQYQVHCDNNNQNGWMYGYGSDASGGNGWWEQCAQWQGFKIYPAQQFTDGRYTNYLKTAHKHILHESPRYDNYFIQDYFTYRQGMDIIGQLWNKSIRPEDPVETYKRITSITQSQFNDEIYECAARFTTWDIPALKTAGASYFNTRPQPLMKLTDDDYWQIDSTVCIENYGYNVIKLNVPTTPTTLKVFFSGKAGINGFRKFNAFQAGWRFGFVALLYDGTRVYSNMGRASNMAPTDTLEFASPANIKNLWLVVTGAPSTHWRHAWDDNDANDEQWPYQVKFSGTNRLGYQNLPNGVSVINDIPVKIRVSNKILFINELPSNSTIKIYNLASACILSEQPDGLSISAQLTTGIYIVNINGTYNKKVIVK